MMRQSGILMHITSLPGPYGVGTMGAEARRFVDFLKQSGQSLWQILPLTPTGYGDSPYQSCSAYAGNAYLIDLDTLIDEGLLEPADIAGIRWSEREDKADFGKLYNHRTSVLKKAFSRFREDAAYEAFCHRNAYWLEDYCLYMALKQRYGGNPWYQWELPLKKRMPDAMENARAILHEEMRFHRFIQYIFHRQWEALRDYAHASGIHIIGDVPIYVPLDSCDVWSEPDLFELDAELTPLRVAGCPPDAFSEDGQLWGNPLYRWDVHKADGYRWWIRRMAGAGNRYDIIRIDHFRGFESYWAIPFGDATAKNGSWVKGPDMEFLSALKAALPNVRMIAEDLGYLTQEVIDMKEASGYPGMKVLQFAFDPREPSDYRPHTYTANSVCYTGTHDNATTLQWFEEADAESLAYAEDYLKRPEEETFVRCMIRTAMESISDTCVIPMQDYLELGKEARMNQPGTCTSKNWTWRADADYITPELTRQILSLTKDSDRTTKN